MILVTGAGGKTGLAVLAALQKRGVLTRAGVRRSEQVALAKEAGASEVVVGDMEMPAFYRTALNNITAIYFVCPNMHPQETDMAQMLLDNAPPSLTHIVYHSVLHPQIEKMPHHWAKMRVEEMLFESGISTTVLQPTAYMQNILGSWQTIVNEGKLRVPYPVSTKISLVHLNDVAEVAALVLTDDNYRGGVYELVGTPALTQTSVADLIGQHLGRSIHAEEISLTNWQAQTTLTGYALETILKMFAYYGQHDFAGNSHVLTSLLQRPPTTLESFITEIGV